MEASMNSPHADEQAPVPSELIHLVRSVWRNTLGHDTFNDDTSFFDAGGDSFVLISLVAKLAKSSGLAIKATHVLRSPTVQGQAAVLSQLMSENLGKTSG
ncbi:phosphopantetheine binding protein [Micromonospora sp. Llam0]|uniref:phosphopantetheine-binding protein n=1 Tax=Micromonospora sp. Llam0 TaxID=2485143 RepID=UPI000FB02498|nr:phosphopantetheine binding protein [Micromonospora sp. Llam0]